MRINSNLLLFFLIVILFNSCTKSLKQSTILNQLDFPQAPIAATIPTEFTNFGKMRIDNYFWIKDKTNPNIIDYLNAENKYTDLVMESTADLQQKIYDEIIGRIKEDDESYPTLQNGYNYYSRTFRGSQYAVYCRKKNEPKAEEEIIFDVNEMANGKAAYVFSGYSISPDNSKAAYFYNETGSFADYQLKIKDLITGKDLKTTIKGASSFAWANDSKTFFVGIIEPTTLRPYQIYRYQLENPKKELVYEERDARFTTQVSETKTREYIFISSGSSTTTEERFVSADKPTDSFEIFTPRQQDVEYDVYAHKEFFFVRYKDKKNLNGKIYQIAKEDYKNREKWHEIIGQNEEKKIENLTVLRDFIVVEFRKNGLSEFDVRNIKTGKTKSVLFPEAVYNAFLRGNPEYNAVTFRYGYTSLNRPTSLFEYNCENGTSALLKQQEVPSGFEPDNYTVERIWAQNEDGTKIPISIIYKKGLKKNGTNPTLLYAYGSYGMSMDVYFSASYYSLIDRGFIFAIAHIRGGSDLGEQWYEDGKLLKKKNTFTDFIACSEKLIQEKYTSSNLLTAMGGSAGGLLMGAVANMRPDLYQTIVSQVPFVDVVNTMLDDTLPLTTGEYEEWGNPNEEEYFNYMLSYSPYDNIKQQNYPNMLITGGLNDSQVLFHEPAKYTAKLRANKTDENIIILKMNMDSGHGGATGRYDGIKETAFELAFILNRVGINE
jgi:oligopeptidase B